MIFELHTDNCISFDKLSILGPKVIFRRLECFWHNNRSAQYGWMVLIKHKLNIHEDVKQIHLLFTDYCLYSTIVISNISVTYSPLSCVVELKAKIKCAGGAYAASDDKMPLQMQMSLNGY